MTVQAPGGEGFVVGRWPAAPVVYEIDTWPWLTEVGRRLGRVVSLGEVPGEVWDEVAAGVDAVWLMGVWERSPAGLAIARANAGLRAAFRQALPDLRDADVVGSPYCVRRYRVDDRLGGPDGLAAARSALARRGVRLILDYVPNHVAPDHAAVLEHPNWFVSGTPADLAAQPDGWFTAGEGRILAHGRDPYFPPWPDVAQLDAFDPGLRQATADTLAEIAEQCDGVRCDMAMLVTNEVFARTWGAYVGAAPAAEFWPTLLDRLATRHPDFVLIAEAYWDTEWTLQQQGFHFCYDKRLYDRLAHGDATAVRQHLAADRAYQDRLIRFVENHDEPRAATTFGDGRHQAAATVVATLPGATLWHDGQFDGRRHHLPVFLARYRDEPADKQLRDFYTRLLSAAAETRHGDWRLLDAHGWPDNPTHRQLLTWAWHDQDTPHHLTVVNHGDRGAQARIPLPWPALAGRSWQLVDLLHGRGYDRHGDDLAAGGLYVDLPPWGMHLFAIHPG